MNSDFTATADPISLFQEWLAEAEASEPNDPNAMALATVDHDGLPDVRVVLMKSYDANGFVFFTNFESAKGHELRTHPKAAAVFHWKSRRRQVRVRGPVTAVTDAEADGRDGGSGAAKLALFHGAYSTHGLRRVFCHLSPVRRKTMRSCRRKAPSCQNSISAMAMRKPHQ